MSRPSKSKELLLTGAVLFVFGLVCVHPVVASAQQTLAEDGVRVLLTEALRAMQSGDNATAETKFRLALQEDPTSVATLNNLAIVLTREGKMGEAEELYARALAIKPGDAPTTRNLAVAYFRQQQWSSAWPLLEVLCKTEPDFKRSIWPA